MKINEIMKTPQEQKIFKIVIDIVNRAVPEAIEIWFHGSRTLGTAKPNSDWDFLVVVPDDFPLNEFVFLNSTKSPLYLHLSKFPLDIQLVYNSDRNSYVSPLYWAIQEGKLIWLTK